MGRKDWTVIAALALLTSAAPVGRTSRTRTPGKRRDRPGPPRAGFGASRRLLVNSRDVPGGAPNALIRLGWKKDAIPAGLEVEITGFRAKNGEAVGNGRSIILPDGRELFSGGSAPGSQGASKPQ